MITLAQHQYATASVIAGRLMGAPFNTAFNTNDITLRLGFLKLDLGNGDAIHIKNMHHRPPTALEVQAGLNPDGVDVLTDFDRNDVFNSSSIGSFEFENGGTVLTSTELLARGFDLDGTNLDDTINGTDTTDTTDTTDITDRINGLEGFLPERATNDPMLLAA